MGVALLLVALGGFALTFVGYLGLVGKLPPNPWAGIRTPFTSRSPEAWYATHRAAAPAMIFGGVLVFAASSAFVPFAFAGKVPLPVATAVILGSCAVMLGSALAGWRTGTAHARRELEKADSA